MDWIGLFLTRFASLRGRHDRSNPVHGLDCFVPRSDAKRRIVSAKIIRIPETDSGILWFFNKTRLIVSLQGLSHHQFLNYHGTVLFNDVDEIDTLVPFGGIDVHHLAFGFVHLLTD